MSAILGYFKTNKSKIEESKLNEMKYPIKQWGPENSSNWLNENIGLGQLLSYNTPEAKFEKLPLTDLSGNLILVSRARIDNRDELSKIFGFPANELSTIPDSRFIMEAFKKWGKECVDHLLGDWAFAIWDKQKKELFVARDHHGNTGLFYYHSNNMFVFSSSIKSLLALKEIPKEINELFVTKVLVSWPRDGEETAYKNIYRLPPAHHLTISAEKFEIKRYWYLENTPLLHLNSPEEYYEQFLEIYQNAVKVRLRSERPVAATLSGGLDSGSVCALAAEELKKRGQRLHCFSSVPKYDISSLDLGKTRFGDETSFIKATADYSGNIDVELLSAQNISVLDGIYKKLEVHCEPGHAAANFYWITEIMEQAKEKGFGTLLTGQGGNATISWKGGGGMAGFSEIISQFHHNEISSLMAIKSLIKKTTPSIIDFLINIRKTNSPWNSYSAINLNYAKEIGLKRLMKKSGHDPLFRKKKNPLDSRIKLIKPGRNQMGSLWQNNGSNYGIEVRDPTIDKQLMQFCLSVPDAYYWSKEYDRFLLRKSLSGHLPGDVLWNKKRGLQSADIYLRIRENEKEIESTLKEIDDAKKLNRMLDLPKMESILSGSSTDKKSTEKLGRTLLRGVGVGVFLKQFEANYQSI
jgi:asparagine synthase (glutamine-hydrolysing)